MEAEVQKIVLDDLVADDFEPTEEEIHDYAKFLGLDPIQNANLLWIAREAIKAPLPEEWRQCEAPNGDVYFFNFKTGESSWDHPCDIKYLKIAADELERDKERSVAQAQRESRTTENGSDESKSTLFIARRESNITVNDRESEEPERDSSLAADVSSAERASAQQHGKQDSSSNVNHGVYSMSPAKRRDQLTSSRKAERDAERAAVAARSTVRELQDLLGEAEAVLLKLRTAAADGQPSVVHTLETTESSTDSIRRANSQIEILESTILSMQKTMDEKLVEYSRQSTVQIERHVDSLRKDMQATVSTVADQAASNRSQVEAYARQLQEMGDRHERRIQHLITEIKTVQDKFLSDFTSVTDKLARLEEKQQELARSHLALAEERQHRTACEPSPSSDPDGESTTDRSLEYSGQNNLDLRDQLSQMQSKIDEIGGKIKAFHETQETMKKAMQQAEDDNQSAFAALREQIPGFESTHIEHPVPDPGDETLRNTTSSLDRSSWRLLEDRIRQDALDAVRVFLASWSGAMPGPVIAAPGATERNRSPTGHKTDAEATRPCTSTSPRESFSLPLSRNSSQFEKRDSRGSRKGVEETGPETTRETALESESDAASVSETAAPGSPASVEAQETPSTDPSEKLSGAGKAVPASPSPNRGPNRNNVDITETLAHRDVDISSLRAQMMALTEQLESVAGGQATSGGKERKQALGGRSEREVASTWNERARQGAMRVQGGFLRMREFVRTQAHEVQLRSNTLAQLRHEWQRDVASVRANGSSADRQALRDAKRALELETRALNADVDRLTSMRQWLSDCAACMASDSPREKSPLVTDEAVDMQLSSMMEALEALQDSPSPPPFPRQNAERLLRRAPPRDLHRAESALSPVGRKWAQRARIPDAVSAASSAKLERLQSLMVRWAAEREGRAARLAGHAAWLESFQQQLRRSRALRHTDP